MQCRVRRPRPLDHSGLFEGTHGLGAPHVRSRGCSGRSETTSGGGSTREETRLHLVPRPRSTSASGACGSARVRTLHPSQELGASRVRDRGPSHLGRRPHAGASVEIQQIEVHGSPPLEAHRRSLPTSQRLDARARLRTQPGAAAKTRQRSARTACCRRSTGRWRSRTSTRPRSCGRRRRGPGWRRRPGSGPHPPPSSPARRA